VSERFGCLLALQLLAAGTIAMPWFRSFVAVMAAFQEVFCWFLYPCSSMNEQAFKLSALTGLSFHS